MTYELWNRTEAYLEEVFGSQDAELSQLHSEASAAGLPDIAINPVVGRLLLMLASMTRGRLAVEVGTLGGYSASWIVRGLEPAGRLITIECNDHHADFAERQFARLGVADRIELRRGDGVAVLQQLREELAEGSIDLLFLDAEKKQYPAYWELTRPLIATGGLVVMDNALGSDDWWIGDDHPSFYAADRANRMIAADPDFEAAAFPLRQGVMIARRMRG